MADKINGHWYTDKNGNHYFVENGQTPKEGWEASKRRKMISGGTYKISEDGENYEDVDEKKYRDFEADETSFDETNDDDFGFDEDTGGLQDYHLEEIEKSLAPAADMAPDKVLEIISKDVQDMMEDGYDLEEAYAIARDDFLDKYNMFENDATNILINMAERDGHNLSEAEAKNILADWNSGAQKLEDFYKEINWDADENEYFTDNDYKQLEKYAEKYEYDIDALKEEVKKAVKERLDKGESLTNAKNDAMEDVLDSVVAAGGKDDFLSEKETNDILSGKSNLNDNQEWEVYDKQGNLASKVKGTNNMLDELGKQFNRGQTVDAPEKGKGWKKTKMASGTLYEGPNGERELVNSDERPEKTKGEWYDASNGGVVYGKDGLAYGYINKHANGKYIPNYTYGGQWRNQDINNLQMFDSLDEAKAYVEKGLNRFSKRPSFEDYKIDDDLKKQLRDYEHYHNVENIDEDIEAIKNHIKGVQGKSWADSDYLGKFDRDIAMLSNPKIRQYINDRNSFNKQFENDFNEYKEEAKQRYLQKILGENDLYKYENRDDFGKDRDDLFDSINKDFAERYGYERTKYGDMFSPLRETQHFSNYYGEDEDYKDNTGSYRRKKLNRDKVIGDLLGSGIITFADLIKMIKGKK